MAYIWSTIVTSLFRTLARVYVLPGVDDIQPPDTPDRHAIQVFGI